jgi:glycosyltransferase involved in cell wall biosynthesis
VFRFFPLEALPTRYTMQQTYRILRDLEACMIPHQVVESDRQYWRPAPGAFLDWTGRPLFAMDQASKFAEMLRDGRVRDGDVVFLADLFHPGLEAMKYACDMTGVKVKFYAIEHAGPFDPTDLTRKLLHWGRYQWSAMYCMCEKVFVGSEHLKRTILDGARESGITLSDNLVVTGQVWDAADTRDGIEPRKLDIDADYAMWPHRWSPDKDPALLGEVAKALHDIDPTIKIVCNNGHFGGGIDGMPEAPNLLYGDNFSKAEYYSALAASCGMLSTAKHENWGYALHEAEAFRIPAICPARACYPEMVENEADSLYSPENPARAARLIHKAACGTLDRVRLKPNGGFKAMLSEMGYDSEGAKS